MREHDVVGVERRVEDVHRLPVQLERGGEVARGVEHLAELAHEPAVQDRVPGSLVQAQRRLQHVLRGRVERPGRLPGREIGEPLHQPVGHGVERLGVGGDAHQVCARVLAVGAGAGPHRLGEPVPAHPVRHPGPHHVLHQAVHPHDPRVAVDERQPQELRERVLQVELVGERLGVAEAAQRRDGDRVRGEERHRLQQPCRARRPLVEAVEGQAPRGGDGGPGVERVVQQQALPPHPEQLHVVEDGHARLLDVGARLLERQRQVAEQLGERVGLVGAVAGAVGDVADGLAPAQRRDGDRPGEPTPRRVA